MIRGGVFKRGDLVPDSGIELLGAARDTLVAGPELIVGLVGAVGTDLDAVANFLADALAAVDYQSKPPIRLATLLRDLPEFSSLPDPSGPLDVYIDKLMTAGNEFRERTQRNDAMAILGIGEIIQQRKEARIPHGGIIPRRAYILRSLKHPDEAETLREVYGDSFFLIAAYAPHMVRRNNLAKEIAQSRNEYPVERNYSKAEFLINRDQEELGMPHGQHLRDTFHRADAFVDTTDPGALRESITRVVELIFGNTFHTPNKDEYAMFHAQAAALRSAELGRQVGAAIAENEGDIVAVGTNEVPKARGGLYWCGEIPDQRECVLGYDSNDLHKRNLLTDTLKHLQAAGWLAPEKARTELRKLTREAFDGEKPVLPESSQIRNLIEFGRAVHAEMAALAEAARRGISVSGCTMFVTTFPCHLCARHIVASGILRVRYIEPYAKSLAAELYPDSIAVEGTEATSHQIVFDPFVGVAPRQYMRLFSAQNRKSDSGQVTRFSPSGAVPRWSSPERVYIDSEDVMLATLTKAMRFQGLLFL